MVEQKEGLDLRNTQCAESDLVCILLDEDAVMSCISALPGGCRTDIFMVHTANSRKVVGGMIQHSCGMIDVDVECG